MGIFTGLYIMTDLNSQIAELFRSDSAQMKCSVSQTTQQTFTFNVAIFLQTQTERCVANSKQYHESTQTMVRNIWC